MRSSFGARRPTRAWANGWGGQAPVQGNGFSWSLHQLLFVLLRCFRWSGNEVMNQLINVRNSCRIKWSIHALNNSSTTSIETLCIYFDSLWDLSILSETLEDKGRLRADSSGWNSAQGPQTLTGHMRLLVADWMHFGSLTGPVWSQRGHHESMNWLIVLLFSNLYHWFHEKMWGGTVRYDTVRYGDIR